jgi:hypothetical protein
MCREQLHPSWQSSSKDDQMDTEARPLDRRTLGDEVSIRMPSTSIAVGCIAVVKEVKWL